MIIALLDYIKEFKYKNKTIYKVDYDFYDENIYLSDLEEVLNNV